MSTNPIVAAARAMDAPPVELSACWELLLEVLEKGYGGDAEELASWALFLRGQTGLISIGADDFDLELRDEAVIVTLHDREATCGAQALAERVSELERAVRRG